MRNIIIPRIANFTTLFHLNQAETSNAIKNILNNVQRNCEGTNKVNSSSLWKKINIYYSNTSLVTQFSFAVTATHSYAKISSGNAL